MKSVSFAHNASFMVLKRMLTSLASAVLVLAAWPGTSLAKVVVRFVHAVPGAGPAQLALKPGGAAPVGRAAFGRATPYVAASPGVFMWTLTGAGTGQKLATGHARLRDGAYTLVALARGTGVRLGVYRDRGGRRATALLRVIHAAPELGSPVLRLDDRVVARGVRFGQATPYLAVPAGVHGVAATAPGSMDALVSLKGLRLGAGQAYTGVVVGSKGVAPRVVALVDRGGASTTSRPLTRRPARHRTRSSTRQLAGATVTVARGDSLWSIARRRAGAGAGDAAVSREMLRLWNANEHRIGTGDPNLILPGTRLRV